MEAKVSNDPPLTSRGRMYTYRFTQNSSQESIHQSHTPSTQTQQSYRYGITQNYPQKSIHKGSPPPQTPPPGVSSSPQHTELLKGTSETRAEEGDVEGSKYSHKKHELGIGELLSPLYFRIWELNVRLSQYFSATPFVWDNKGKKLRVSGLSKGLFAFKSLLLYLHVIFNGVQGILCLLVDADLRKFNFSMTFFYGGLVAGSVWWMYLKNPIYTALIINQEHHFLKQYSRRWIRYRSPEHEQLLQLTDRILVVVLLILSLQPLAILIHFLVYPYSIVYLPSLLPKGVVKAMWLPTILGGGPLYFYQIYGLYSNIGITLQLTYGYFIFASSILWGDFLVSRTAAVTKSWAKASKKRVSEAFYEVRNFTMTYRTMEVLNKRNAELFGDTIALVQVVATQLTVMSIYMFFRYWKHVNRMALALFALWSIFLLSIWAGVLQFGVLFYVRSELTIRSWTHLITHQSRSSSRERKYLLQFQRSCRPLHIGREEVCVVGRKSVLEFFQWIIRGTLRALLTTK